MFGCTIDLDLSEYFSDIRKYSCIYIDFKQCKKIRDAENHIKRLFNINEDICLVKTKSFSNDVCLFPSDENIRLFQSVCSTIKVKVIPAQSFFQPLRETQNTDSSLSVITIKDENFDCKIEENDVQLESINQNDYYDSVRLEVEESECNQCNVVRDVCDSSIQTDLTSLSENVQITEFPLNDKLSKTEKCVEEQMFGVFSKSNNSKADKSVHKKKSFIPLIENLDTSQEYETDCEILNSEEKVKKLNKSLFQDELIKETNKEVIYKETNSSSSENMVYEDCAKEQVKRKRKKEKHSFSNDIITDKLSEAHSLTKDLHSQDNAGGFYLSEIKNNRIKRKKSKDLDVENSDAQYEYYGSDVYGVGLSGDKHSSSMVSNTTKYSNDKQEINVNKKVVENNNCKVKKIKNQFKENQISSIKPNLINTKWDKSENTNYAYETEESLCLPSSVKNGNLESTLITDPLAAFKNTVIGQINATLIELNKHEMVPNSKVDVKFLNKSIANKMYVDSSCAESEKNSVMMDSVHTSPVEFVDFPKRRRRKRRHNTKAKVDKHAAAMKPNVPLTPSVNFPRSNSHKFFSDDDFIEDVKSPETPPSQNCVSLKKSDICNSSDADHITVSNSNDANENSKKENSKDLNAGEETCKLILSQNVPLSKKQSLVEQGLRELLKKTKINKKVAIFEYIPPAIDFCLNKGSSTEGCNTDSLPTLLHNNVIQLKHLKNDEVVKFDLCENKGTTKDDSSKLIDVSNYPIISNAMEGDVIIFKMLRLGSDYQPEISQHVIANIISIDSSDTSSKVLSVHVLRGVEEFRKPEGKFSIEEEEDIDCKKLIDLQWSDLIEPRLFYP